MFTTRWEKDERLTTDDGLPLFSSVHKKDPAWGTQIRIGNNYHLVWLESIIDYIILLCYPPSLTEDNLENLKKSS